jgi:hypothetical protein
MTILTPTEEQALDAMRASLIDGPRPALGPGHGDEAFTQHVLLGTRFLQAALLNKRKGDRDGEAWVRYFEEHVAAPEAKTNAQLLWDEWRTSLVKEDSPGVGIAITHGQPEIHWKSDQTLGLCLDLESMWADFDASVDHLPIGVSEAASAAASPPDEPPAVLLLSCGLRVAPYTRLTESQNALNSDRLVFPSRIAPALRIRRITGASSDDTLPASNRDPFVAGIPATGITSFAVNGTPCNGPSRSPRATCASASRASLRASSSRGRTIAFTSSLHLR